jgi:hypothetical protein
MRIGLSVTWDCDVFPSWRRSANNAARPNSDVWRPLPAGIRWYEGELEESDVPNLFLIGSADLQETFGSYRIIDIERDMAANDGYNHRIRIRSLVEAIRAGRPLEWPILVSESAFGPFVFIDGNHRGLAYYCEGRLPGLRVYLGLAPGLLRAYCWASPALAGYPPNKKESRVQRAFPLVPTLLRGNERDPI